MKHHNADLDWYFGQSASAMGERSTFSAVTSALESGGASPCYSDPTNRYSDRHVGWCAGEGLVERARRISEALRNVPERARLVLAYYYLPQRRVPDGPNIDSRLRGEFGRTVNVALMLGDTGAIVSAATQPHKQESTKTLASIKAKIDEELRAAHAAWSEVSK